MPPSPKTIREQLERLATSPGFARAERMTRFLRFVVENSIEGHVDMLRERQIGIEVFERPEDWDPKLDNIVRSEARRLRAKLDSYAAMGSPDETVRITMPKGGYLVEFAEPAPGVELALEPRVSSTVSADAGHKPTRSKWQLRAAFVVCSVVVLIAVLLLLSGKRHTLVAAKSDTFEVVPFSTETGQQFSPSISPDGTRIAFVWNGTGNNYDIYIKALTSGNLQRITDDPAPDTHPSWSPDASRIAFLRRSSGDTELILKSLGNGSERVLQRLHDPLSMWSSANPLAGCQSVAWSPNGKEVLVTDALGSTQGYGLVLISTETGERKILTQPRVKIRIAIRAFRPTEHTSPSFAT